MIQTLTALCLRTVRHNDNRSILSIWTAEVGRTAVIIPAGTGKTSSRFKALTMPLSLIETQIDIRPNRELHYIKDLRPICSSASFSATPVKSLTAVFIADFLDVVLRNSAPDQLMSRFIFDSVTVLNKLDDKSAANFSLYFLLKFSRFAGIEPDWSEPGNIFDPLEGCFRTTPPLHNRFFEGDQVAALRQLSRIRPRNIGLYHFTRQQRSFILQQILEYYNLHNLPVNNLASLSVVSSL